MVNDITTVGTTIRGQAILDTSVVATTGTPIPLRHKCSSRKCNHISIVLRSKARPVSLAESERQLTAGLAQADRLLVGFLSC